LGELAAEIKKPGPRKSGGHYFKHISGKFGGPAAWGQSFAVHIPPWVGHGIGPTDSCSEACFLPGGVEGRARGGGGGKGGPFFIQQIPIWGGG